MKAANEIKSTFRKNGINVTVTSKRVNLEPREGLTVLYYSGGLEKFKSVLRVHFPSAELNSISAFLPLNFS